MNALSWVRFFSLVVMVGMLSGGCSANGAFEQAKYDRKIQRAEQMLLAAGDPDSLATAAILRFGPSFTPAQPLELIARAVSAAPNRADLVWLNISLCKVVETCNPAPLEENLRAVDPDNGAGWLGAAGRAAASHDAAALRTSLAALAATKRLDTYWNVTNAHVTSALVRTKVFDPLTALTTSIGMTAAGSIPAYQSIVNACRGDALADPETVITCRRISAVMRNGDTYLTELIGTSIAKRVWSESDPEYADAVRARRVARYRMDAVSQIFNENYLHSSFAENQLKLMTEKRTEQEVNLTEILNAKLSPDPPTDWVDKWERD